MKTLSRNTISLAEARAIALVAQGYGQPLPAAPAAEHIREIVQRLGVLQLDFVNVLVPAHYLVMFSRLGAYRRSLFEEALYPEGSKFTEAWAHEASLIPVESWPLFAHRRATHRVRPWGFEEFLSKHADYAEWVVHQIRERGAQASGDLRPPEGVPGKIAHSWYGSTARATLEAHFGRGVLAVRERRPNFARVFDLSERLIPSKLYAHEVGEAEARRALLLQAAKALGVATLADLADYFRMRPSEVRGLIADELERVQVEGWTQEAYLAPRAAAARIRPTALLSPFDPLVWYRPRTERLFGFDYRLEIFVPAEQRRWGYYVLPFLYQGELAARVDLKADRTRGRLLVLASFVETGHAPSEVAEALGGELRRLASWLDLDIVAVGRKGNLARHLRSFSL